MSCHSSWQNLETRGISSQAGSFMLVTVRSRAALAAVSALSLPGMTPQLPNNTRWTSQRAALHTFVRNHSKYVEIRDEQDHDPVRFIQ